MSSMLRVVVNGLQLPARGLTVAEARALAMLQKHTGRELPAKAEEAAKAVQDQQTGPAESTPESTENGEAAHVKTQPTQEGA
jgi:hypothetical protein